jgi:hypothetical protein
MYQLLHPSKDKPPAVPPKIEQTHREDVPGETLSFGEWSGRVNNLVRKHNERNNTFKDIQSEINNLNQKYQDASHSSISKTDHDNIKTKLDKELIDAENVYNEMNDSLTPMIDRLETRGKYTTEELAEQAASNSELFNSAIGYCEYLAKELQELEKHIIKKDELTGYTSESFIFGKEHEKTQLEHELNRFKQEVLEAKEMQTKSENEFVKDIINRYEENHTKLIEMYQLQIDIGENTHDTKEKGFEVVRDASKSTPEGSNKLEKAKDIGLLKGHQTKLKEFQDNFDEYINGIDNSIEDVNKAYDDTYDINDTEKKELLKRLNNQKFAFEGYKQEKLEPTMQRLQEITKNANSAEVEYIEISDDHQEKNFKSLLEGDERFKSIKEAYNKFDFISKVAEETVQETLLKSSTFHNNLRELGELKKKVLDDKNNKVNPADNMHKDHLEATIGLLLAEQAQEHYANLLTKDSNWKELGALNTELLEASKEFLKDEYKSTNDGKFISQRYQGQVRAAADQYAEKQRDLVFAYLGTDAHKKMECMKEMKECIKEIKKDISLKDDTSWSY